MKIILLVLMLTGCAAHVDCNLWHVENGVKVCETDPWAKATDADFKACEAEAQTVSPCPDLKAEKCESYWATYNQCMDQKTY